MSKLSERIVSWLMTERRRNGTLTLVVVELLSIIMFSCSAAPVVDMGGQANGDLIEAFGRESFFESGIVHFRVEVFTSDEADDLWLPKRGIYEVRYVWNSTRQWSLDISDSASKANQHVIARYDGVYLLVGDKLWDGRYYSGYSKSESYTKLWDRTLWAHGPVCTHLFPLSYGKRFTLSSIPFYVFTSRPSQHERQTVIVSYQSEAPSTSYVRQYKSPIHALIGELDQRTRKLVDSDTHTPLASGQVRINFELDALKTYVPIQMWAESSDGPTGWKANWHDFAKLSGTTYVPLVCEIRASKAGGLVLRSELKANDSTFNSDIPEETFVIDYANKEIVPWTDN